MDGIVSLNNKSSYIIIPVLVQCGYQQSEDCASEDSQTLVDFAPFLRA